MTQERAMRHPLTCPTLPDIDDIREQIGDILASGRVTVGGQVQSFESEARERLRVKHAIAVSSGTSALMLLLRALDLPDGGEVIVPSFTFAATCHALLWNNLKPVFCDSEPHSLTMDALAVRRGGLITSRTCALYPVCIAGVPGDLDAYRQLAEEYGLALLFDSAQGLGAAYKGSAVGGFGLGEAFSLSPTKVVTAMEGGLVTTNNDHIAESVRRMRDYGKAPDGEDMHLLGLSARMTEVNALIARWSLARLDTWLANRGAIMERYQERLRGIPGIRFQKIPRECVSSRNYMVILLDPRESPIPRDDLHAELKAEGIQTKRFFYPALHNQTLYRNTDPQCAPRLPVAEQVSRRSLALPMYSHMPIGSVDEICERITRIALESSSRFTHDPA